MLIDKIGIIGGSGQMGQMFGKSFELLGKKVLYSDKSTISFEKELVQSSDLVIVCVPLGEGAVVINRIAPYLTQNHLLSDFASVKTVIVPEMLKTDAQVISSHPMFGRLKSMANQNIILLPVRPGQFQPELKKLYKSMELNVVIIDEWERHDNLMSYIQGLMHFFHIVFTQTMRSGDIDLSTLLSMCSPVYRANFAFTCRILQRDPHLYTHILMDNPENLSVLKRFVDEAQKSIALIECKDEETFIGDFLKSRSFLEDHGEDFSKQSDYLIEQLKTYSD